METSLIDRRIAANQLPAFAALGREAARFELDNPMDDLPGAIWPEINTGRAAGALALYFHPAQLHTGEAVPRIVAADEIDASLDWWNIAGSAGRRVLVLDAPQAVPMQGTNGIHIADWGTHDRAWDPVSEPPDALEAAHRIVGPHSPRGCDATVGRGGHKGYETLLASLVDGLERRTRLAEHLMAHDDWDVAHVAISEAHCAGHHFWGFTDAATTMGAPRPGPADARLSNALDTVYRAIDGSLARIRDAAGPRARVMVIASHGMGPYIAGYQLLPEVLVRLGLRPAPQPAAASLSRLPEPLRASLRRVVPATLRNQRLARAGTFPQVDLVSSRTRATTVANNRCGAIRLNLRGREPNGCVEPGAEAESLVRELRSELLALTQPGTDERIVTRVTTSLDRAPEESHPDLPDVTVAFRRDLGPLEACESPRLGRVEVPYFDRRMRRDGWPRSARRSGDHTDRSRLWLLAPGVRPGPQPGVVAAVRDVAPTALAVLGVDIPTGMTGRSVPLPQGARIDERAASNVR